jgi:hypothetical protein
VLSCPHTNRQDTSPVFRQLSSRQENREQLYSLKSLFSSSLYPPERWSALTKTLIGLECCDFSDEEKLSTNIMELTKSLVNSPARLGGTAYSFQLPTKYISCTPPLSSSSLARRREGSVFSLTRLPPPSPAMDQLLAFSYCSSHIWLLFKISEFF